MNLNSVNVSLPGIETPVLLPANQVCPHSRKSTKQAQSLDSVLGCDSAFSQQASDDFTFSDEIITVSVGTPAINQTIQLTKGLRQTLLIPSNLNQKWALVSYKQSHAKEKRHFNVITIQSISQLINRSLPQSNDLISKPEKGQNSVR